MQRAYQNRSAAATDRWVIFGQGRRCRRFTCACVWDKRRVQRPFNRRLIELLRIRTVLFRNLNGLRWVKVRLEFFCKKLFILRYAAPLVISGMKNYSTNMESQLIRIRIVGCRNFSEKMVYSNNFAINQFIIMNINDIFFQLWVLKVTIHTSVSIDRKRLYWDSKNISPSENIYDRPFFQIEKYSNFPRFSLIGLQFQTFYFSGYFMPSWLKLFYFANSTI